MLQLWRPVAPVALLLLTGCGSILGGCDTEARPGIRLEVVNAETGEPEDDGAVAKATKGSSVTFFGRSSNTGVREMFAFVPDEGRYTVEVSKEGFGLWTDNDVDVDRNSCGFETTEITAALETS
jgi:hypothetical protein